MARVNYSKFDYKQACARFNMVRMHYIGKEIGRSEIIQAVKTAGFGWNDCIVPFLVQFGCILKTGYGRTSKFAFTSEPLHFTKLYDAHKAYLRAKREKKTEVKSVQKEVKRIPYWTSTTTW